MDNLTRLPMLLAGILNLFALSRGETLALQIAVGTMGAFVVFAGFILGRLRSVDEAAQAAKRAAERLDLRTAELERKIQQKD